MFLPLGNGDLQGVGLKKQRLGDFLWRADMHNAGVIRGLMEIFNGLGYLPQANGGHAHTCQRRGQMGR